jgi:hypothetical protein
MKYAILTFFSIVLISAMNAQNPRIETQGNTETHSYAYTKGGDSIRFTIVGKTDTTLITELYRSGKIERLSWKEDSIYRFDELGHLSSKGFKLLNGGDRRDSTIEYFSNGQPAKIEVNKKDRHVTKFFSKNGKPSNTDYRIDTPTFYFLQYANEKGQITDSRKIQTVSENNQNVEYRYDTSFYAPGQAYKTSIERSYTDNKYNSSSLGINYYNIDGSLAQTIAPDRPELTVFKDNIDCLYGLKNKKGDTVVTPRFDYIDYKQKTFWVCSLGNSLTILDLNGVPIKPFATQLTDINGINSNQILTANEYFKQQTEGTLNNYQSKPHTLFFIFKDGDKYGVIDQDCKIIMTPQYFELEAWSYSFNGLFSSKYIKKDSAFVRGFLTEKGEILYNNRFNDVTYAGFEGYFSLGITPYNINDYLRHNYFDKYALINDSIYFDLTTKRVLGLGDAEGNVILEPKFVAIQPVSDAAFVIASLFKLNKPTNQAHCVEGIFNLRAKRWILDTSHFIILSESKRRNDFFIVKDILSNKMGLIDTAGRFILSVNYDSITLVDIKKSLFWVKKDKNYQILDIKQGKVHFHKAQYDFIDYTTLHVHTDNENKSPTYFIARCKNKWGLMDVEENIIKPFEYDYAAVSKSNYDRCLLVKNNQVASFSVSSLPNSEPIMPHQENQHGYEKKIGIYDCFDNSDYVFFADDTGKIVIPPQYKRASFPSNGDYEFIKDDKGHKKVVFMNSGKLIDFSYPYSIEQFATNRQVMFVKNKNETTYGVVSNKGKLLIPCENYGLAFADVNTSVFFVKKDKPILDTTNNYRHQTLNNDSLNIEDMNWLIYDKEGRLLDSTAFRFPIQFQKGVGIGMKNDAFNLYKTDGSILTLFSKNVIARNEATERSKSTVHLLQQSLQQGFKNIRRDENGQYYTLFYNQGLITNACVVKTDGEIIVENGRYDGISDFYGNYALVTAAEKVGLIDSLGKEIIAPQDLQIYQSQFVDSLMLFNKWIQKMDYYAEDIGGLKQVDLPFYFDDDEASKHPDSLSINAQEKAFLWNLLLDKLPTKGVYTINDVKIPRVEARVSDVFFSFQNYPKDYQNTPKRICVTARTIAFVMSSPSSYYQLNSSFYNFYRRNNRWEELKINDLLQIQGDKRWQINDLISQKVKALKDKEIDCSNTAAFITKVENRFMLTEKGIDFCFNSTDYNGGFVIVSFTWEELSPFLKLKIF